MISYRIEGNYPVHNSTVTLGFSNEEPIIKVADIIANLGYKYSDDKTIYPIQSGEELVWVCERDETCTSRVIVELSAPYQAKYQKIDIAMPRGFEDKFEWKNPDEDPIIARTYVGDTNFKIQFSQVVEAHEIIDWVKIAGRDCILSSSGTQFIWKDTDPEHETPLEDITAGYVPECDELTIFVPADSRVDTVQWVAAEPIPIEQMYHKKEHMPFFPKTAFGAVFDHNGNSLSRVMSDMTDRMRLAEEDIDDLEAAIGGKVDFDDFIKRVKVNTLPVSLESEDETKYIYHLIEKSGTHEPGYYIFAGNNEVGNPIFNRIDNTLDDVENAQAYKFYARKLNTLTGKLEWKPVTGGGAGGVQDVTVNGESVVDDDGVAVIDTTEFGKVQNVLVDGASVLDADGNAIIDLTNKADKATTLAGYEIGDAYTKDEVDAKIDEKIETLNAAEVGTAGQYIQKIKEENGIITATVADVKQTYSATDTEPISGAGVKAAIDELDVDVVGEDGKYLKTIKQDDGKITAVAEAFDTTITAAATDKTAPTSKAVHTVTGLVTDITEDAAKSDGTATGTAPKDLAEAINNVAKNAGKIQKVKVGDTELEIVDKTVTIETQEDATDKKPEKNGVVKDVTLKDGKINVAYTTAVKADETTEGKANQYGFFSDDNTLTGKKLADVYDKTTTGDDKTDFQETAGTYVVPTTTAVKGYLNDVLGGITGAMVFKGDAADINPAEFTENSVGWTYIVGTEGTYQGMECKAGDMLIIKAYPVTGPESWTHITTPTVVVPDNTPELTLEDTKIATVAGVDINAKLKDAQVEYTASIPATETSPAVDAKLESKETTGTVTGKDIETIKDYIDDVNKVKDVTIDGKSIVDSNKVAVIPAATKEEMGVAKIDTDVVDTASTAKTFDAAHPSIMTAKAVEDSLAFIKVNGQTGAAILDDSGSTASATNAVAMGAATTASGQSSVSMGLITTASGNNAVSMGFDTEASGENSLAIGMRTIASGVCSFAGGSGATASNTSFAFGDEDTKASGFFSVALGQSSTASANYAIAAGNGAAATGVNAVAMGLNSTASGLDSLAASGATAEGEESIAIGKESAAKAINTIAIGATANVAAPISIAIGVGATVTEDATNGMAMAIGTMANATADNTVAIGNSSNALAAGALAIKGTAEGKESVAIGGDTNPANAQKDGAVALGAGSVAKEKNSIALGMNAEAKGEESVAIVGGVAEGKTSLAFGEHNVAKGERSIAGGIYDQSLENVANGKGSIAFGNGVTTGEDATSAIALGMMTEANGENSIATGMLTKTTNSAETAAGVLNLSHELDEDDPKLEKTTMYSIGAGTMDPATGDIERKNAFEVTTNGDIYVLGVGNYDGKELKDPYVDEDHPGNDIKDLATTINDLDFATTSAIHDLNERLETLDRVSADADVVLNNKVEMLDRVSADADLVLNKKINDVDYVTALALHDLEDRKVAEVVGEGDVQVTRNGDTVKLKVTVPKVNVETYTAGTNITIEDIGAHEHQINAPQLKLGQYQYRNPSGNIAYKTEDRISLERDGIDYKIHLADGVPFKIVTEGTFGSAFTSAAYVANEGTTKVPVATMVHNANLDNFGVVAFAESNSAVDNKLSDYKNSSKTYFATTMHTCEIVDYIRQYSASYRGTVTATQLSNMSAVTPSYYGTSNHLGKLPYEGWIVETAAAGEYTLDPVPAVVKATLPKGTFLMAVVNPRSSSRLLWKVLEMPADAAFDENSTNAVQNKVITKYIKENETTVAAALHELRDVELPLRDEEIERRKTFDVTVAGESIVNENGVAEIPELGKIDQVLIGGVDYHGTTEETRKIVSIPCKYEPATDPVTNPLSKFTVGDQVAEIFSDEVSIKLYIKNLLKQVFTYDPVTNSLTADLTKLD